MTAPADAITIALGPVDEADVFGLAVEIDGMPALHTITAAGPGVFRAAPAAGEIRLATGWIIGFIQRGPLLIPVIMPQDGWVLAAIADGTRVEHGSPILRILPDHEGIVR